MGIVYCISFPCGKKYIGQTVQQLSKRIQKHRNNKDNTPIARAFKKYYNEYKVEILLEVNNDLLNYYEIKFINIYDTLTPYGYNIQNGGAAPDFETRNKVSKSQRKSELYLPMYIWPDKSGGYTIRPNDGRPNKTFTLRYLNKEIALEIAKEYLYGKETILQDTYLWPKYVVRYKTRNKSGYRVMFPNKPVKVFGSSFFNDDEKFAVAKEYVK